MFNRGDGQPVYLEHTVKLKTDKTKIKEKTNKHNKCKKNSQSMKSLW